MFYQKQKPHIYYYVYIGTTRRTAHTRRNNNIIINIT